MSATLLGNLPAWAGCLAIILPALAGEPSNEDRATAESLRRVDATTCTLEEAGPHRRVSASDVTSITWIGSERTKE